MDGPDQIIPLLRDRAEQAGRWRPQPHAKGAMLLSQGAPGGRLFVLLRGLVKLTYLSPAGDEWIKSFVADQGLFGDLEDAPQRFGAVALEDSQIAVLPAAWVNGLIATDPAIVGAAAGFSRWLADRKQAREEALLCATPEQRYQQMLITAPALLARLPQQDIARYLRVTPIAFSRIKRRLRARAG